MKNEKPRNKIFYKQIATCITTFLVYNHGFAAPSYTEELGNWESFNVSESIGTNVIEENTTDLPYIALTSSERGFKNYEFRAYWEGLEGLVYYRAQKICESKGFRSLAAAPKTTSFLHFGKTNVWIPVQNGNVEQKKIQCKRPWIYTKNGNKEIGLPLSVIGRVLTYIPSPISPIGMIIATSGDILQRGAKISRNKALERLDDGKPVMKRRPLFQGSIKNMIPSIDFNNSIPNLVYKDAVPHLIFSELKCTNNQDEYFDFDQVPRVWIEWDPKSGFEKRSWGECGTYKYS